jgi:membrane protease YdiL (CAAX protease family)
VRTRFFYINTERPATGTETEGADVSELAKLGTTALALLILAVPAGLVCLALWRLLPRDERRLLPWPRTGLVAWAGVDVWVAFLFLLLPSLSPQLVSEPLTRSGFFTLVYGDRAGPTQLIAQAAAAQGLAAPGVAAPVAPQIAIALEVAALDGSLEERQLLWVGVVAFPFQVAMILAGLAFVRGVRPAEVGLTGRRFAQNVVAGYLLWLVLAPLALLLYWVVTLLVGTQKHPIERLSQLPLLDVEWAAILFLAVVSAPVLEELVFRGVLLRWQTSHGLDAQLIVGVAALLMAILGGIGRQQTFNPGPMIFILVMLPSYVVLPYLDRYWREHKRRRTVEGRAEAESERNGAPTGNPAPWQERVYQGLVGFMRLTSDRRVNVLLAFYGNGLLFAALHSSVWPTPIPLFSLGFGLAWLAHRTQSLVGPLVAHALFNGVACLDMFLS